MTEPEQLILNPTGRRESIIEIMRSAKQSLRLSLFRCDDSPILDEIILTARRGVDVRVLVTPKARGWGKRLGTLLLLLKDAGVSVKRYDGPWPKYHAKYMIVDDARAMIGSLNLTRKCLEETCDFILISGDPGLVSGLANLFEFDWHTPHSALPALSNRIIVGPDRIRDQVTGLIRSARRRICIIDHRVGDTAVLLAIAGRMQEGVHTETLGRGEAGTYASHGKLMLIDDRVALFGSAPLSRQGLDKRREVAVLVEDPSHVQKLCEFFGELAAINAIQKERPPASATDDDDEDDDED